jgi:hypothetical protein
MNDEVIKTKCNWCGSKNIELLQDNHHKKIDDSHCGIVKCNDCGDIAFWFLKIKSKTKILPDHIEVKANMKFAKTLKWDGPITQWIWLHIEEACEKTGKQPIDYYVTYVDSYTK